MMTGYQNQQQQQQVNPKELSLLLKSKVLKQPRDSNDAVPLQSQPMVDPSVTDNIDSNKQ